MTPPRFDPTFSWGHVFTAVSIFASVMGSTALFIFATKERVGDNSQAIEQLKKDDLAQDKAAKDFRDSVLFELRSQSSALRSIDQKFGSIEARLSVVEERTIQSDKRLQRIESRLDGGRK